jgi:2-oxoisovalerate dehydrogenase E1 component
LSDTEVEQEIHFRGRAHPEVFSFYVRCSFIRKFENQLLELFSKGRIGGTTHTAIGQEANAVGIAAACRDTDIFVSNHRCHAHILAHVGEPEKLLWEIMGSEYGFCGGLGGSQHICVPGKFYSNGIQGGIAPLAVGLAFAKKLAKSNDIVCLFVGDGTTGEGALYESLNLAGLLRLPLLMILEDNGIAQTTPTKDTVAGSVVKRLESFALATHVIDYPTAAELHDVATPIVTSVRSGNPAAIIIRSTRLGPHSKGDDTRDPREIAAYQAQDPLKRMAEALRQSGRLDEAEAAAEALIRALDPVRDSNAVVEEVPQANYARLDIGLSDFGEIDGSSFVERLNNQLINFMDNERGILLGEDIGDPYGGAFKVTKGLQTRFPKRVFQMPISEQGFTGMAAGLAISGWRPMVEIMFGDFVTLAFDQLVNHAAKYPLMYNKQVQCPLVVRLPMGGGVGYGPTHSQSLEKHLCGVPNLQVFAVSPYLPLRPFFRAIGHADAPVVLIEYKQDYTRKAKLTDSLLSDFDLTPHGASVEFVLKGSDEAQIAIFAYGGMIALALEVARRLLIDEELSATVFGIGQLHPLNLDSFVNSRRPGLELAVTLEEGSTGWGFGAEISAIMSSSENFSRYTKLLRIGASDTIVPASRKAEKATLPGNPAKITAQIVRDFRRI